MAPPDGFSTTRTDLSAPHPVPVLRARAHYLGGRVPAREVEGWPSVATSPLTLSGKEGGFFVLLRFGVLVEIGVGADETDAVLERIRPLAMDVEPSDAGESAEIRLVHEGREIILPDGEIQLKDLDVERAQVVATVLAKSAALTHYEARMATVFDRVETLATQLRDARVRPSGKELLNQIGEALLIRTRMVGRVEVGEKPEITWDEPELDRLYERLAREYELAERDRALSRKLEIISDVAETYLELLDTRKSLRLEW
ncbi:MAG: RMD1 family protein, partial [Gemmatimonadota bacterium]